ncbi:MAG TPA: hypothetical protein EYP88_06285 [Anaerolineales bacterium]|nr:hypothetical protein [Anaerolineales bacterium]
MTRPINVEGVELSFASMTVTSNSSVVGKSIDHIEQKYQISVVLLKSDGTQRNYHPAASRTIAANDTLAVLGEASHISVLAQAL